MEKEEYQDLEKILNDIPSGSQTGTAVGAVMDAWKTLYYIKRLKEVSGCDKVILKYLFPPLPTHPKLEAYYNEYKARLLKYTKDEPIPPGTGVETKNF